MAGLGDLIIRVGANLDGFAGGMTMVSTRVGEVAACCAVRKAEGDYGVWHFANGRSLEDAQQ